MKTIHIKQKLADIEVPLDNLKLGDFDFIGEYTAKKSRDRSSENYKKHGCFFRPNYERGILMHYMVQKLKLSSVLEIGFRRGYATFCMARAMCEAGIDGKITTVDPNLDENFLNHLTNIFPKVWFEKIGCVSYTFLN